MDVDDNLDIERVLARNISICEDIKRYEERKMEHENKSKYNQTEMNRVVIDIPNYATSDEK